MIEATEGTKYTRTTPWAIVAIVGCTIWLSAGFSLGQQAPRSPLPAHENTLGSGSSSSTSSLTSEGWRPRGSGPSPGSALDESRLSSGVNRPWTTERGTPGSQDWATPSASSSPDGLSGKSSHAAGAILSGRIEAGATSGKEFVASSGPGETGASQPTWGASRRESATSADLTGQGRILPATHGQVWREYDIRPYTLQIHSTRRPEVAVVDWILRETGYEVWFGEVPALLSASRERVFVYHTPAVQEVVAQVIERFTTNGGQPLGINFRLIVVSNPSWLGSWLHALTPVRTHSQGIRAWVLYREDASLLVADLRRRPDYREHAAPQLSVPNGQTTVLSATRARPYTRHISWRPEAWPGFSPETAFIDEGFTLEISPLLSTDRRQVDAVLRMEIWQVERLIPLALDVAGGPGQPSRPRVEIPQRVQLSFHERFRWPIEQALLVDLGVVPVPIPVESTIFSGWLLPFSASAPRGNVLLLFEIRSSSASAAEPPSVATPRTPITKGY